MNRTWLVGGLCVSVAIGVSVALWHREPAPSDHRGTHSTDLSPPASPPSHPEIPATPRSTGALHDSYTRGQDASRGDPPRLDSC